MRKAQRQAAAPGTNSFPRPRRVPKITHPLSLGAAFLLFSHFQLARNVKSLNAHKLFQCYLRVNGAHCSLRVKSFECFWLPCEMTIAGNRNVSFTKKRYIPSLQLHKRRGLPRRVGIDPRFGSPPDVASKCVSFGRVTGKSD